MYLLELAGTDDAFAAREAASAADDVTVVAPGLATARGLTDRVVGLALTHRASELIGWVGPDPGSEPDLGDVRALLSAAAVDRTGTVAVRARDVRGATDVDTQRAERELGAALVERGFEVDLEDPDHVLRAIFSTGYAALGWRCAESVRDFGARQPTDRPFFQPGSMDPLLARALANIAGARPGTTVLDPMCGTGGGLIEAGLVGADVVGADAQAKMVRGARRNLRACLTERTDGALPPPGDAAVLRGDATALPLADDAVDGVVFDAPYGRQSKIAGADLASLVEGALWEARRLAPRAVVVADRPWTETAEAAGWTLTDRLQRRVHRSLTRHVHVLARE